MNKTNITSKKIKKFMLFFQFVWILIFTIMNIFVFTRFFTEQEWFSFLMNCLYCSWIILIIPIGICLCYIWWDNNRCKILHMDEEEIIEYYEIKGSM